MTENSNSNDDNGAGQIAMTDDLFGWPGDGVHWTWQRCGRYKYQKVLVHDQPRPPGSQRSAWERRDPPGSRPARGREEATQYHQLRILCALRDKIAENERGCPLWARGSQTLPFDVVLYASIVVGNASNQLVVGQFETSSGSVRTR